MLKSACEKVRLSQPFIRCLLTLVQSADDRSKVRQQTNQTHPCCAYENPMVEGSVLSSTVDKMLWCDN